MLTVLFFTSLNGQFLEEQPGTRLSDHSRFYCNKMMKSAVLKHIIFFSEQENFKISDIFQDIKPCKHAEKCH